MYLNFCFYGTQDEERGKLLSDIRSGARLKHVPWPQEKKAGEVEITNVESELRNIVQRRRRKEVCVSESCKFNHTPM